MKTFNRILSLLMIALMLVTFIPYTTFAARVVDTDTENYTLTIEETLEGSFTAENSAQAPIYFFGRTEFDGCYGNQLSSLAKELYSSLVKNYVEDKRTREYIHNFNVPFIFNAEVVSGSIVENDALKAIYIEIDNALWGAVDAFLFDHPEVFWLYGFDYSYSVSASGNPTKGYTGYIYDITITPKEIYSGASSKTSQYTSAVENVLDAITVTDSIYDTLKNVHDYICENAWYNLVSERRVHSSEPFFVGDGGFVCEGYAKTLKVLCDRLEIPCVLVVGYAGGAHMWNYVQMDDGKWYLVDATWNDQSDRIYDTYFLADSNTIGFNGIPMYAERTAQTDFSGTGIFNYTYPVLSSTAYVIHIHEWESDYTIDTEPTCTENGSKSIHCATCNKTKTNSAVAISAKGHKGGTATCTAKAKCTVCKKSYGSFKDHSFSDATCTTPKTCMVCEVTFGNAKGHNYTNACDTICNTCSAKRTTKHTYTNACDTKCNVCSAKRTIKHTYTNACDTKCNVCSAKRTTKHTYTNACDTKCNVCSAKRTITHSYKTTTTKATLSKNGKIVKKCSVCDKVESSTTIKYAKTIKLSATSYTYNGKTKKPTVTVKDSAGKKISSKYYTVTYKNNKNVGKATVTIKMKGNYSGTKTLTFKINPVKTSVSKLKAGKKSITVSISKKSTQVTGYQIQYSTSKSFSRATTKNISSYKTTKNTLKNLSAKKTYYVRVRTYKKVGSTTYYSDWSTAKSVKTK